MPRNSPYAGTSRDGETRTRTGDTTIFRQPEGASRAIESTCKSTCLWRLGLWGVPRGFVRFPVGYGRGGSPRPFRWRAKRPGERQYRLASLADLRTRSTLAGGCVSRAHRPPGGRTAKATSRYRTAARVDGAPRKAESFDASARVRPYRQQRGRLVAALAVDADRAGGASDVILRAGPERAAAV
jgi:hypothetical protein